ncbi:spore gernimation protein [Paenibacillaceae bacterium]|nr:spore gernimation protein [Paenibacillaceae bacterium]
MTQFGIMLFSIPRIVADNFGTNGWVALLLSGIVAAINIGLIGLVYRLSDGNSIFELLESVFPKFVLFPCYILLASIWSFLGCLIGKQYILLFQMVAFPTTSPMIFKFLFDILAFLLLIKGIYNISKASNLFFFMTIWVIFIIFFYTDEFQWIRLTPFLFRGGNITWDNSLEVYTAFLGYELSMLFFPYVARGSKFIRAVHIGNLSVMVVYILFSIISFGFFSFGQLRQLMYPFLDLLAYIQLPFIERIENLLFTFFLFNILITTVMYFWGAAQTLKRAFPRSRTGWVEFLTVLTCYIASFFLTVISEVEQWLRYLGYSAIAIAFGLPLILLVILLVRRGKRKHAKASEQA